MTDSVKDADQQPDYVSFLLRLWRVTGNDRPGDDTDKTYRTTEKAVWRASVESPLTGEQQGFADLDELFDFLRGQTNRDKRTGGCDEKKRDCHLLSDLNAGGC